MDKITISALSLQTVIGTLEAERTGKQEVILTLEIFGDFRAASSGDSLRDAVDYLALEDAVAARVENSSFFLLEALAGAVAETILSFPGVERTRVKLEKPEAPIRGRVALEIERP